MTKQEILDMTGLTEDEFYAQYPTEESFKQGGWIQKATASIKKRGTEGVCTGSNFGGPSCRPGTKRYALAKTFRKMAKARKKEDGGMVEMYEEGGDITTSDMVRLAKNPIYIDEYNKLSKEDKQKVNLLQKKLSGYSYEDMAFDQARNAQDSSQYAHGFNLGFDMANAYPKGLKTVFEQGMENPLTSPYGFIATGRKEGYFKNPKVRKKADGGVVDVYQLMGMPTPEMYAMGGDVMIEDYARGGMIKRKDGSYSKRGLWDNIRANRGSGKKPTKEMLKQERKIRAAKKKEYGGMVDMYNNGGPTKGYLNVSQSSYPFPDEVISNSPDYRDIEYSRVASGDISLGGGVRLGREGKAYMVGSLGAQKGKKREITEADDKSYRIGDWEDVTTPTGKLGVEFLPFNSRSNKKKRGFTAAESSGEAGISYVNDKMAPYFRVSPEVGYRFGAKKNAPGYVSAGIDMGFRPRSADTYMAPGSNAEIIRAAGPNEVFTGANYLTPRVGGEYTFRNVGITPYAEAGYNLLTRNPNLEIGIKKGFAYGGSVPGEYSHVFSPKNHSNMGYAMGGAINYPEGLQMPIFAMGGMTNEPTQINVERGELLTDKDGRIVTEYKGGGMVPHPKEGIDERGTVSAQEGQFVIPTKYAESYKAAMKNNDGLLAKAIRRRIVVEKAKNEAKDAQIAAAEEQKANKAMNRMMAKYGGAIQRMYAKGGMVPMYDGGAGVTGPRVAPFFNFPDNNYFGNFPDQIPYQMEGNEGWGSPPSMTNPVTGFSNYLNTMRQQGIKSNQDVNIPTMARSGFDANGNPVSINPNMPSNYVPPGYQGAKQSSQNFMQGLDTAEKYLPYAPFAWNAIQAMRKPSQVPKDLGRIKTTVQAPKLTADAAMRALERQAALGKYNINQLSGSDRMAGMSNLAANRMAAAAGVQENLRTAQGQLDFQAAMQNMARDQFNAQGDFTRYGLQAEADAVPTQYASAAATNLGEIGKERRYRDMLQSVYGKKFLG